MRVLIADDDPVTQYLITEFIKKIGFEYVMAQDGEAAWAILKSPDAPRVLILDWMMPGMNGVEICRRLRSASSANSSAASYCYIIIITAGNNPNNLIQALEAGADDFIAKPLNLGELQCRLNIARRIIEYEQTIIAAQKRAAISQHMEFVALMASGIAHEINQPLNAMQIMLANLSKQLQSPVLDVPPLIERTAKITAQAQRIVNIIASMRRMTQAVRSADLEPVSLSKAIINVLRLFGAVPANRHISLAVHVAPDLPKVIANPLQLEQVLFNLVNNAIQVLETHPHPKAEVKIAAGLQGEHVVLRVADNGPGLQYDVLNADFTPRSPPEKSFKMGIGLQIVRKFVQDWGATITAANLPDAGAEFSVTLRADLAPAASMSVG